MQSNIQKYLTNKLKFTTSETSWIDKELKRLKNCKTQKMIEETTKRVDREVVNLLSKYRLN